MQVDAETDSEIEGLVREIAFLEFKKATLVQLRKVASNYEAEFEAKTRREGIDMASIEAILHESFRRKMGQSIASEQTAKVKKGPVGQKEVKVNIKELRELQFD